MKKRIIALVLCIMMLTVSLSSCGVVIGGFKAPSLFSEVTAVMSSENYSINVGMMAYYYNTAKNSMTLSSLGGSSSPTNKVVISGNGDGEIKYYVSTDIADMGDKVTINGGNVQTDNYFSDNVIIYDKVTDFEISEGVLSGNVIINGNDFVIGALSGELIMNTVLEQAREILVYCEIADMYGIKLSSEEEQQVEEEIRQYTEYMFMVSDIKDNTSGVDSFAASILTEVLTDESDIEAAATYARIAEKTKNWLYENAEAGVSSYDIEERYERQEHFEGDEENTRDFHFIFIKDEARARKIVSALKSYEVMYSERFVEITRDLANMEVSYVDCYSKGDMGSYALDEWLFNANTGDYTEEPVYDEKLGGYFVAYYERAGDPVWYVRVREEIIKERFEADLNRYKEVFPVSTNESMKEILDYMLGA